MNSPSAGSHRRVRREQYCQENGSQEIPFCGPQLETTAHLAVPTSPRCQRLSSHAYIFSASPPPYAVVAAKTAIQIIEKEGEERIAKLRENTKLAREQLSDITGFEVLGDSISPLIHLKLGRELPLPETNEILEKVCDAALNDAENPTLIVKSKFVIARDVNANKPTIKIFISPAQTKEQIINAMAAVKRAAQSVLSN